MAVKIIIVETGDIFDTITDCARYIDGDVSTIAKCVRGERSTYRGLHFKGVYIDEPVGHREYYDPLQQKVFNRGRPRIGVRIVNTGEEFESISECARFINGDESEIAKCLTGYRNRKTHRGLSFERIGDTPQ